MKTNKLKVALLGNFIKTDWQYSLPGTGYEIVSVLTANDYVYVASNGYIFQLDPEFGTCIQQNNLPGMKEHEVRMIMSRDNKTLIIGTYGNVLALNAEDISQTLWTNNLPDEDTGVVSISIGSDRVFAATGGYVNALNLSNGTLLAKNSLEGMGISEVRLALSDNEKYLIAGINGNVLCLDATDISKDFIWKNSLKGQGEEVVNLLTEKKIVFVGTNGYVNSLNLSDGTIIQTNDLKGLGNHEVRLCLSANGMILSAGINGNVVLMDVENLKVSKWTTPLPESSGNVVNLIADDDGAIYAGAAGRVSELDPTTGKILVTNNLPQKGINEVRLSLGKDQTNLYIGTNGYAIGTSEFGAATMNRNSWMESMGKMIEHMQVKEMLIPGTHDSASYGIDPLSSFSPEEDLPDWLKKLRTWGGPNLYIGVGTVAALWSKAQGYNIYSQLMGGIRYFDLRLSNRNGKIWTSHSLYSVPVDKVLDDVKKFITSNPREIIILDFNHFYQFDQEIHDQMAKLLFERFGNKMAEPSLECSVTVGRLWQDNKQLLTFYSNKTTCEKYPKFLWEDKYLYSPYYGETNMKDIIADLDKYLGEMKGDTFSYLHGQLTPDFDMIKDGLTPFNGKPSSLMSLAEETNPKFIEWIKKQTNPKLNIIASDWVFTMEEFLPHCILVNKSRAQASQSSL